MGDFRLEADRVIIIIHDKHTDGVKSLVVPSYRREVEDSH